MADLIRPSNLYRRQRCPGSMRMEAGIPETQSAAAGRGSELHALIKQAILDPASRVEILDKAGDGATMIQACVTEAENLWNNLSPNRRANAAVLLESPIDMTCLGMQEKHVSDFAIVVRPSGMDEGLVIVRDWKSGHGFVPPARWNPQLGAYAYAIAEQYAIRGSANIGIVQPEARDYVDYWVADREELDKIAKHIKEIRQRCEDPEAQCIPGPWCQYCKAAGRCESRALVAAEVKQITNPVSVLQTLEGKSRTDFYERLLRAINVLTDAKDEIHEAVVAGALEIPEYGAAPGRKTREWGPAKAEVMAALATAANKKGLNPEETIEPVSVAKAEKLLGSAALSGMVVVSTGKPSIKKLKVAA